MGKPLADALEEATRSTTAVREGRLLQQAEHAPGIIAVSTQQTSGFMFNGVIQGELLVLPPFPIQASSPTGDYSFPIPLDCTLTGSSFSAQGASFSATNILLSNAIDFTLGNI